jgi:hypothetical protein
MDYHELEKTKVTKLREMAEEHLEIEGISGKTKEELVDLLADKLGIEKPHLVASGIGKRNVKAKIRELKVERDKALAAKDSVQLKRVRRRMHRLRHKLRKAAKDHMH